MRQFKLRLGSGSVKGCQNFSESNPVLILQELHFYCACALISRYGDCPGGSVEQGSHSSFRVAPTPILKNNSNQIGVSSKILLAGIDNRQAAISS